MKTRVYSVGYHNYDQEMDVIVASFVDKDLSDKFFDFLMDIDPSTFMQTIEVDDHITIPEAKGCSFLMVVFDHNGNVCEDDTQVIDSQTVIHKNNRIYKDYSYSNTDYIAIGCWSRTEEEAVEMATRIYKGDNTGTVQSETIILEAYLMSIGIRKQE